VSPDSPEGRKSAVIGIVILCALVGPMCAIIYTGYEGHVSLSACVGYCVSFWALLAFLLAVSGLAGHVSRRAVLRQYAAPPEPDMTAQLFRDRAAQLRGLEASGQEVVTERERRVLDLLSVLCPVAGCRASAWRPCLLLPRGVPYAIVQNDPPLCCHLARMRDAVRYGSANAADITAQFDNNVPSGVL
jgi:hypothetical protein